MNVNARQRGEPARQQPLDNRNRPPVNNHSVRNPLHNAREKISPLHQPVGDREVNTRRVEPLRQHHVSVGSDRGRERDIPIGPLVVGGLAAAAGVAALANADNQVEKKAAIKGKIDGIIDNNDNVEHKWIKMAELRIADHKSTRALSGSLKAICLVAAGALIAIGAVFQAFLALQIGIVVLGVLGLKCLYDLIRNKTGKAIAHDENWLKRTHEGLNDPNTHEKFVKALQDEPMFTSKNYMTVQLPSPTL